VTAAAAMSASRRKILIADDDADLRLSLKLAFELADYEVEVAGNARDALAAQRRSPADILVTDIFMPDGDGFEAIDGFRREFPGTKIVVVSGGAQFAKHDYLRAAALIGVDATLAKPFEVEKLLETLRSL
jgi:YesN/AraC family two-component response regulator